MKKVPADQCEEVPGVKCFFELVDVETPVCHEVPVEDFYSVTWVELTNVMN